MYFQSLKDLVAKELLNSSQASEVIDFTVMETMNDSVLNITTVQKEHIQASSTLVRASTSDKVANFKPTPKPKERINNRKETLVVYTQCFQLSTKHLPALLK